VTKILVVEDEPDISQALQAILQRRNFDVVMAEDGPTALRLFYDIRPDLIILDLGLPVVDGWHVLSRIRDFANVPVIILTAAGHEEDKVRGLRSGADDYLTKPFSNSELVARVEALLRRAGDPHWTQPEFGDGQLVISPGRRTVTVEGLDVALTPLEFRLLSVLVRNAGQLLGVEQLLSLVWEDSSGIGAERVKYTILRLRRKLGWDDPSSSPIESVRGAGYRYKSVRSSN